MDMEAARNWILEHKLRAVGTLWASSLLGSLAYNFARPGMKMSVKLIHARLHAQFLTLGALGGSALVEAYDQSAGDKAKRYEEQFQV
ncbi:hypothetical protein M758_12G065200 [Ceratodon purpureus]|nr:hypothetical protein M758_12G065200 [Ceratodon purpureus]